ncbi:major facilitator superfamily MFS_1 [Sphingobium chlorophenolicum L-1]|uniref:Major facilitator superfamily MFS_1 n=1 Tax=Sphingobium chlorophenolicum L-1 TaxID=690566 RepID=F6EWY8_SPHCR|nr:MFS transporter [Sphingobium chlorophenolicum]AEG48151.1 major facilitator superfamily MFS_1 [Sphingobium chlorophenolicum L-1]
MNIVDDDKGVHRDVPPLGIVTIVAVFLLAGLGQIVSYITPFTLTALMKGYGLSQGRAAVAVSVEIGSLAVAMLFASRRVKTLNLRFAATAGTLVALAGQAITLMGTSYAGLLVARGACGLGTGFMIAVAYSVISRSPAPARLFTYQSAFLGFLVVLLFAFMPQLQALIGPAAQFLGLAIGLVIALPFALTIKQMPVPSENVELRASRKSSMFWLVVICVVLFGSGSNALWLHFETMGELRGVTFSGLAITTIVSAGTMMLAPAVSLAAFRHVGGFRPIIIGNIIQMIVIAADLLIDSAPLFIASALVLNFIIAVQLVYARILAADMDSSGSMASGVGGADFAGTFVGPLIGGLFIVHATENQWFVAAILSALLTSIIVAIGSGRILSGEKSDGRLTIGSPNTAL